METTLGLLWGEAPKREEVQQDDGFATDLKTGSVRSAARTMPKARVTLRTKLDCTTSHQNKKRIVLMNVKV